MPPEIDMSSQLKKPHLFPIALVAFTSTTGITILTIVPGFIGAVIDYLGFSAKAAGVLASFQLIGTAIGALLGSFLIHSHIPLNLVRNGLLAGILFYLLACFWQTFIVLTFLLLCAGISGGIVISTCLSSFARIPKPETGYSAAVFFQFLFTGLGLLLIPYILPIVGIKGLFVGAAFLCLAGLIALRFQNILNPPETQNIPGKALFQQPKIITAIAAAGIFQCGIYAIWSYMDRIGLQSALSPEAVGATLGIGGGFVGLLGAILSGVIGLRMGYLRSVSWGVTSIIFGALLIIFIRGGHQYIAANIIIGIAWAFSVPYFQALLAKLDSEGRVVAIGASVALLGIAMGPAFAAMVISSDFYTPSLWLGMSFVVASVLLLGLALQLGVKEYVTE